QHWGADGFAYRNYSGSPNVGGASATDQIILFRSRLATASAAPPSTNPQPTVTAVTPTTLTADGGNVDLTVTGANFVPGAVARWNGSDRTTAFVNAGTLRVQIPASDLALPGTAHVSVVNPSPGGG